MQPTINYTNMDLTQVWILYIYGSYTDMDLMDEIFVYFPNFVHSHFQDYTHYESTKWLQTYLFVEKYLVKTNCVNLLNQSWAG